MNPVIRPPPKSGTPTVSTKPGVIHITDVLQANDSGSLIGVVGSLEVRAERPIGDRPRVRQLRCLVAAPTPQPGGSLSVNAVVVSMRTRPPSRTSICIWRPSSSAMPTSGAVSASSAKTSMIWSSQITSRVVDIEVVLSAVPQSRAATGPVRQPQFAHTGNAAGSRSRRSRCR